MCGPRRSYQERFYRKLQSLHQKPTSWEKPDCLITITSDEEFWNMLSEHECAEELSSPGHVHLFILQDKSSLPTGIILGAMKAKKNVAEDNDCVSIRGSVESNTSWKAEESSSRKKKDIKACTHHWTILTSTTFASRKKWRGNHPGEFTDDT